MALITWYVDGLNGNNNNPGHSSSTAFKTLARVPQVASTDTVVVNVASGSIFRELLTIRISNVTFQAYGNAPNPPVLVGSTPLSSGGWTPVVGANPGPEYQIATNIVFNGNNANYRIWWYPDQTPLSKNVLPLAWGTAGTLGPNQYVIANGFLNVNIGRAPMATDTFEIPSQLKNQIEIDGQNGVTLDSIAIRFSGADGVYLSNSADGAKITNCDFAFCNGGLIHATNGNTSTPATNLVVQGNILHDQYGQQNAVAFHKATTAKVSGNLISRIAGWGITASHVAKVDRLYNTLDGAKMFVVPDDPTHPGTAGGVHNFIGNQMINEIPEGLDSDPLLFIHSTVSAATIVNIYHHSQASGTARKLYRAIRVDSGTVKVRNVALYGTYQFNFMNGGTNTTVDSDYVASMGIGHNVNWPTSGAPNAAGTHDVLLIADPYTNVAQNDLSPRANSPLLHAGVDLGSGLSMPSGAPDIGYTGAAIMAVPPAVASANARSASTGELGGLLALLARLWGWLTKAAR